jgi:Alg9-like mannosyltransferase family
MRELRGKVIYMWEYNPLPLLLCVGIFFRLLAVLFSKGFGMHDDHFLVIEASQSWVDGADYNFWLPTISKGVTEATGHSLLYPGFHYSLFYLLQKAGMMDPQLKMYVVRFLHAAFSLLVIVAGYKIAYKRGSIKSARESGLLLAILFFMPMLSVRNLVEVVCSVPLLLATWYIVKSEKENWKHALMAGIMLGIAFSVRFQTVFFLSGLALALLLLKQWKNFFYVCTGFIISVGIIQTFTDIIIWKKPFIELTEYVRYNIENKESYGVSAWHKFLLLTAGILIPPMSLLIITGFLSNWKKNLILFLPAFLFFVVHSLIPNKQERFILPVIPFIVIAGIIGWNNLLIKFDKKIWLQKLTRVSWIVFFILNTIPLFVVSTSYSKRSRVEAMYYLNKKNDTQTVLIEESIHDDYKMPPLFYLGKWGYTYNITKQQNADALLCQMNLTTPEHLPRYVVFNQIDSLDKRVEAFKKYFPHIVYEASIEPGFLDKILYKLNPKNANFTCYIYKINYGKEEMEKIQNATCPPLEQYHPQFLRHLMQTKTGKL